MRDPITLAAEVEAMRRRIYELEEVIANYAERYGLSEKARAAMIGR